MFECFCQTAALVKRKGKLFCSIYCNEAILTFGSQWRLLQNLRVDDKIIYKFPKTFWQNNRTKFFHTSLNMQNEVKLSNMIQFESV